MKRANPMNINSRYYWNQVYGTPAKRETYARAGTDHAPVGTMTHTSRFSKTLEFVNDGDQFLDIGCGVGVMTKLVKDTYPNCRVWGVDISDRAILANRAERPDINYAAARVGALSDLPQCDFDVVFAGEILEHLDEPAQLFRDAHALLKPGGTFVLTTPKENAIRSDEHTWFFTYDDIETLYKENGFEFEQFVYLPDMEHLVVIMGVGRRKA